MQWIVGPHAAPQSMPMGHFHRSRLPVMYLILHALGLHASIKPDTYTTGLLLTESPVVVCAVRAHAGALVRRTIWLPSQSVEAFSATGT